VSIDLGHLETGMAEELLDLSQMDSLADQIRGSRVPQAVEVEVLLNARLYKISLEKP